MSTFKKISLWAISFSFVALPIFVNAQAVVTPPSNLNATIKIDNPLKDKSGTLVSLLNVIINDVIMPIAAVFVVVWIIYAGFKYVIAQGNPKKIEEAHHTLLWALIGAGILLGAAGISKIVETTVTELMK